jgi:hypothetical protein
MSQRKCDGRIVHKQSEEKTGDCQIKRKLIVEPGRQHIK